MTSKCSIDKYNQEFIQKSHSLPVPVDPNKSFNPNLDSPSDLDDICTSISQVPINPLYIENPTSVSKIALPEGKLLEDDRFWGAQVEKQCKMINKPLDMLDNQHIIEFTSESVDSFTPNKKKEKFPGSITSWSVALIANNLVIVGNDSNGKRQITSCCRRISSNIFHDNNGVVCSLLGSSEPASDLPKYISDKFKNGIPVDWQSVVITWGHFQSLGCPASYKWPTMSQSYSHVNNYETDTEIGQNRSTITVQQLRKKITKMQTRYRTMLFRESLLGSCTNSIHDSSLYLSSNVDIPCVNSTNKIVTNVNISRPGTEIEDSKVHAVNNLFLRDKNIEVVSYHKKPILVPEENSDVSESDTESDKNTDSLHLQMVSSGPSNFSNNPNTNEETTNNPKINENQRHQKMKDISKTNEDQLKVIPKTKDNLAKNNPKTNENQQIKVIPKTIEKQLKVICKTNENLTKINPKTNENQQMKVIPKTIGKQLKVICKTKENLTKINPKTNESQTQINPKTNENQTEVNAEPIDGSKPTIVSESEMIFPSETKKPTEEPKSANHLTISGSSSFVSVNFSSLSKVSSIKEVATPQHTKVSQKIDSKPSAKTVDPSSYSDSDVSRTDLSEHVNMCFKHPKNIKNLRKNVSSSTEINKSPTTTSSVVTITDNIDKEEFLKPASTKVVKKRGRPPKPKPETPKKRGRLPKNKPANDISENKIEVIPEQIAPDLLPVVILTPLGITTPNKRERPSKNKSLAACVSKLKDKIKSNETVTETSITSKPKNASPSKLKDKMAPQLPPDSFLVQSSIATIKKRGRNTSRSRETNQELLNSSELDSTKNRGRKSAFNSECNSSNVSQIGNSSLSRSGRIRIPTLPFWKGHRLTTYKDEVVIQRSVTEKCNLSNYVHNYTINDQSLSKTNVSLSYEEVFHSNVLKNSVQPVQMQLMSTLRDSLINDSVTNKTRQQSLIKINEKIKSPVRNKKTTTQKSSEKQMSAKKQLNSAATETIDSCTSSPNLTNRGSSTNSIVASYSSEDDNYVAVPANRNKSPVKNVSLVKSTSKTKTNTHDSPQRQLSAKKQLTRTPIKPINRRRSKSRTESYSSEYDYEPEKKTKSPFKNVTMPVKSVNITQSKNQKSPQKLLSAKKQLTRTPIKPINRRRSKSRTESYSSENDYEPEEKTKSPVKNVKSPVKSVNKTQFKNKKSPQKQLTAKKQSTLPEKTTEHVETNENINSRSRIESYSSEDCYNESYSSEDYFKPKQKTKSVKNVKTPVKSVSKTQSKNQKSSLKQLTAKKQLTYPEKTTEHVETNENRKQLPIRKRARSITDVKNTVQKYDTEIQSPLRKRISSKKLNFDDSPALKQSQARKETKNTPKNAKPENKSSKSTATKGKNTKKLLKHPLHTRRSSERRRSDINYNEKLMWVTNTKNEPQTAKKSAKSKKKSPATNNFNFVSQDITSIEENIPRSSLENKKMGLKVTTKFKASKPKKIKKVVIPTDHNELFLYAAKTRKAHKKVPTLIRRPTPKQSSSKKRKLFASNSWLQSDECIEHLSKNNPENDMPCPKFVLTFESNIKRPADDDDMFSEVSALVK